MAAFPKILTATVPNGITITSVRRDALPIVSFSIHYPVPWTTVLQRTPGASYLFSRVLDEGAGGLSAYELSDRLDFLGSFVNVNAGNDSLSINLQCMAGKFRETLELVQMILMEPHLAEADFRREKDRLLISLSRLKDNPEPLALTAFFRYLFADNPQYAVLPHGTLQSVSGLELEDMQQLHRELISGNTPSVFITGDFDENALHDFVTALSCCNSPAASAETTHGGLQKPGNETGIFLIHKAGSVQTELMTGHQSGTFDETYHARLALNSLLGGQFFSRLNRRLREELGYTYGIQSGYVYQKNAGYFFVGTSVDIAKTGDTVMEIEKELNGVRAAIGDEELSFTRDHLTNSFKLRLETNNQVLAQLVQMKTLNLPPDFLESYVPAIQSLTAEKVLAVAREALLPAFLTTVLVGDEQQIRGSFAAAGLKTEFTVLMPEELL